MSFGENLANLRKQKGWSQDDLANNFDLSRQAISKWENDQSKPDVENVQKISKAFGINIDELLDNVVPKEKAVTLEVKKTEKKGKAVIIVKLIIIAVIILYLISVIYKFASLLIIVNRVQKYAKMDNYHYVITTYDENGLVEKEECWFKDGVSKTENIAYNNEENKSITFINFKENNGYLVNNGEKGSINVSEYLIVNDGFNNGGQFYSKIPNELKNNSILTIFLTAIKINTIKFNDIEIFVSMNDKFISLGTNNISPVIVHWTDYLNGKILSKKINLELNSVQEIKM